MGSYIPNYTKKLQILRRKEAALRRAMQRGDEACKLLQLAAEVRDARVRVLVAKRAVVPPRLDVHGDAIARWTQRIEAARAVSPDVILDEFR